MKRLESELGEARWNIGRKHTKCTLSLSKMPLSNVGRFRKLAGSTNKRYEGDTLVAESTHLRSIPETSQTHFCDQTKNQSSEQR